MNVWHIFFNDVEGPQCRLCSKITGRDDPVNHGKSKDENETKDNLEREPLQKIDNNENENQPNCDSPDLPKYTQVLRDINLSIRPGNLVGVAGAIGSGKSSLISSILGEVWTKIKWDFTNDIQRIILAIVLYVINEEFYFLLRWTAKLARLSPREDLLLSPNKLGSIGKLYRCAQFF